MPTKPMADAITSLSQQFFTPPQPVAPGGPALPERLPEDETNPFMLLMDAIRGATYGAEDSRAAKFGALMSAMAPVIGGPMMALKGARAAKAAEGAGADALQGIKAYHGSAADFERFDPTKIGSGEGAQSYGYGHYFAENPKVAEEYKRVLSGREFHLGDKRLVTSSGGTTRAMDLQTRGETIAADALDDALNAQSTSPAQFAANRLRQQERLYPEEAPHIHEALNVIAEWQKTGEAQKLSGRMYDVNIKADPAQFLQWDQPLSQQSPQVQATVRQMAGNAQPVKLQDGWYSVTRVGPDGSGHLMTSDIKESTPDAAMQAFDRWLMDDHGANFYRMLGDETRGPGTLSGPQVASAKLQEAGIPGIRYLDQGSRDAGKMKELEADLAQYREAAKHWEATGNAEKLAIAQKQIAVLEKRVQQTHNYVVFPGNEALIDILRKYGIPAALASALAKYAQQPQGEQAQ